MSDVDNSKDTLTLSIPQAAQLIGTSQVTIRNAVKRGELRAFVVGERRGRWLIHREDLEEWLTGLPQVGDVA